MPEDRVLNMRRVKVITGPEISARYCGQDSAPYDTTHGLIISTNHDPVVVETDTGSWRRLRERLRDPR
jgi:putative DNA primase/helicase